MKVSSLTKGILKHGGFGLIEALAAVAILGVVALGLISQQNLSTKSMFTTASDAEINNITKRVLAEIGDQASCTRNFGPSNFESKSNNPPTGTTDTVPSPVAPLTWNKLVTASDTEIVSVGTVYGVSTGSTPAYTTTLGTVKLLDIATYAKNDQEMVLRLTFQRQENKLTALTITGFNSRKIIREISLSTIKTSGAILSCFGDYDLIATIAVELSCKGNTSKYFPPDNVYIYGHCEHNNMALNCPTGQFIKTAVAVNGETTYTCAAIETLCPAGQYIKEFKSDGTVTCDTAFGVKCAANDVIVKNAAGQLICSKGDCTGRYPIAAFAGFDTNGAPICTTMANPYNCPSGTLGTQVSANSSVTCNTAVINGRTCPVGSRISGIDAAGTPVCTPYIILGINCSSGYAIKSIDANGNAVCGRIERPLACNGSMSAHSYNDCTASGGSVQYPYGGNSHCVFSGASCPGGWNRCYSFGSQTTTACLDTSNTYYCDGNRSWRYAYAPGGDWVYGNNGQPGNTCYQWTGFPLTGHACYAYAVQNIWTTQQQVGCY